MSEKLREAARHVVAEATSGANDHEYYQISDYAINDLRAALAEPDVCVWHKDTNGNPCPGCNTPHELCSTVREHMYRHGECGDRYCPACGKRIEVKE